MKEIKKETKFLVINRKKLDEYFSQFIKEKFITPEEQAVIDKIPFFQVLKEVRTKNKYIVCNQDEPYAEKVWKLILRGEQKKQEKRKP